ncbi:MAG: hypothetical protein HFG71_13490 [Hungatella sp.]|jgi:2,4-dienoyl-CoA reductase-like NADH-dependent reductase (Old Yellow Enzyme family)|nr:hypothetical protein [Hungatella sp.]
MENIHSIKINSLDIPTNVFFSPINPGYCVNGILSKEFKDFFIERSGLDIGICYIGNVSLLTNWSSNINTAVFSQNKSVCWSALASEIKKNGSYAGIQLAWKPEAIKMQKEFVTGDVLGQLVYFRQFYDSFDQFDQVSTLFSESISQAFQDGFQVIQLHAAHGYGLSLLLSREVSRCENPRETKGARLIRQIVDKLLKREGILDIRISLYEGINDGSDEWAYKTRLFEFFQECGFNLISLSNGFYNIDKNMIYPVKQDRTAILKEAETLAGTYQDMFWNVAGNMEFVLQSRKAFPPNLTFSLGRQLLSDPKTILKIRQHRESEINKCSGCNKCHYYSYGLLGIQKCELEII